MPEDIGKLAKEFGKYAANLSATHPHLAPPILWGAVAYIDACAAMIDDDYEPDLSKCPGCGGPADNGHDRCMPPNPYYCTKCEGADAP